MALAALASLALFAAGPARAWGALGHRTVGAIAWANIQPETRARIRQLMAHQKEMDTPACPMKTIKDVAVWPDCIKGENWRWAYASSWHYHDQPVCGDFNLKEECRDGNCVTAQITRNERLLADRKLAPILRLQALSFVVHFVGDVHQPLHVGENHDLGGNRITADYGAAPARNLHSIWDGVLAERAISSANPPLVRTYSKADKARLATGDVADWARESWQISKDFLYPEAFGGTIPCNAREPARITWSEAATEKAIPIVDQRIEQAGLRLAKMLDAALAKG
ncbi:S1/P1 nuclease [Novosphingobium sp. 1949]|uniref:S1/P1 nuclease n=1 Tax=Novosphingobium organovorum TaxID=2930092 RepID=A0ABT0BDE3_9SPHN|nr:S1/P1 nuclease [Novosphingobium organovorum]